MPYPWQAGSTSSSTVRAARLYRDCSLTSPNIGRRAAASWAWAMCQPAKFDEPA